MAPFALFEKLIVLSPFYKLAKFYKGLLFSLFLMDYVCFKCSKTVELNKLSRVRCPYCGGKILYKKKPEERITVNVR